MARNYYSYNPWQERFDRVIENGRKLNEQFLAERAAQRAEAEKKEAESKKTEK